MSLRYRQVDQTEYPGAQNTFSKVAESVKAVEHDAVEYLRTLTWHQIEDWQRDNEYIVKGYRRAQYTWKGPLHSVFGYIHNESVNIHTHLFGALVFLVLLIVTHGFVLSKYTSTTPMDLLVLTIFLTSAVFCLMCSSIFHMSSGHSYPTMKLWHAMDYVGIVVLIVGSSIPAVYYAFYCIPRYQLLYIGLMIFFGSAAAYIVLTPEYSKPAYRGARTKIFIGLGLSSVIPVSHTIAINGLERLQAETGLNWIVFSGALYIIGALIYANRFPEKFSPGTFDYFFASHQIFHVFVVLAALSHYAGLLKDLQYYHGARYGKC